MSVDGDHETNPHGAATAILNDLSTKFALTRAATKLRWRDSGWDPYPPCQEPSHLETILPSVDIPDHDRPSGSASLESSPFLIHVASRGMSPSDRRPSETILASPPPSYLFSPTPSEEQHPCLPFKLPARHSLLNGRVGERQLPRLHKRKPAEKAKDRLRRVRHHMITRSRVKAGYQFRSLSSDGRPPI